MNNNQKNKRLCITIFITNNLLILSYVILKLIDFITTFQYLGVNSITESNPFAVDLVKNPLLLISLFTGMIIIFILINIFTYLKHEYSSIQNLFLLIIFSNLIGFGVLIHNFYVFVEVF